MVGEPGSGRSTLNPGSADSAPFVTVPVMAVSAIAGRVGIRAWRPGGWAVSQTGRVNRWLGSTTTTRPGEPSAWQRYRDPAWGTAHWAAPLRAGLGNRPLGSTTAS